MCVILSFSYKLYTRNIHAIRKTITKDSSWNAHGAAILLHQGPGKALLLQSMNNDDVLRVLSTFPFKRAWVHLRAATTHYVGLPYCHAYNCFSGWYVMHNGIIHNPGYPVDSMAMMQDFTYEETPTQVQVERWLQEPFNNTFLVNPEKNAFWVIRSQHGQLHTDGLGNYSSSPISRVIDKEVPTGTVTHHNGELT